MAGAADRGLELKGPSQIDPGKRYPVRYVSNRSFRGSSECLLSSLLCKVLIAAREG